MKNSSTWIIMIKPTLFTCTTHVKGNTHTHQLRYWRSIRIFARKFVSDMLLQVFIHTNKLRHCSKYAVEFVCVCVNNGNLCQSHCTHHHNINLMRGRVFSDKSASIKSSSCEKKVKASEINTYTLCLRIFAKCIVCTVKRLHDTKNV